MFPFCWLLKKYKISGKFPVQKGYCDENAGDAVDFSGGDGIQIQEKGGGGHVIFGNAVISVRENL